MRELNIAEAVAVSGGAYEPPNPTSPWQNENPVNPTGFQSEQDELRLGTVTTTPADGISQGDPLSADNPVCRTYENTATGETVMTCVNSDGVVTTFDLPGEDIET